MKMFLTMFFKKQIKKRIGSLPEEVKGYVRAHYEEPGPMFSLKGASIKDFLNEVERRNTEELEKKAVTVQRDLNRQVEKSFVDRMLEYVSERKLKDSEVYRAARVDRRLYSKMVSDRAYKPSKDTCVALCLALKLSEEQAKDLQKRAGHSLSPSYPRDLILEYCFREGVYDLRTVNEVLYYLNQHTLGR